MASARGMAFGSRGQIFHAVVDHFDWVARLESQQRGVRGQDRWIVLLAAKGAAGLGLNHTHLVLGQIEDRHQRLVHVVRALQRAPHHDAALGAVLGDDSVVFNVKMLLRAGAVFAFDDVRCAAPCRVDIALFKQKTLEAVIRAPNNDVLPLAVLYSEDRRQRVVFDVYGGHGLAQFLLARMRQQHNRFLAVIHLPVGKAGLVRNDELDVILAGNIGGRYDSELAPIDARIKDDGANKPARDRTANRGAVRHAIAFHVVHIVRAAQQLVDSLFAGDGSAYDAGCRMRAHGWPS